MISILGFIVMALDTLYLIGAVFIAVSFHREWKSLKRGIVNGKLTDRNMKFMDALIGDNNPVRTGFVLVIAWPKYALDILRGRHNP